MGILIESIELAVGLRQYKYWKDLFNIYLSPSWDCDNGLVTCPQATNNLIVCLLTCSLFTRVINYGHGCSCRIFMYFGCGLSGKFIFLLQFFLNNDVASYCFLIFLCPCWCPHAFYFIKNCHTAEGACYRIFQSFKNRRQFSQAPASESHCCNSTHNEQQNRTFLRGQGSYCHYIRSSQTFL